MLGGGLPPAVLAERGRWGAATRLALC